MRKVKNVTPHEDYKLNLVFDNNEVRLFDVKPYLEKGIFCELKDPAYFNSVKLFFDSIQWPHGQDFDPDHLYIEGQIR